MADATIPPPTAADMQDDLADLYRYFTGSSAFEQECRLIRRCHAAEALTAERQAEILALTDGLADRVFAAVAVERTAREAELESTKARHLAIYDAVCADRKRLADDAAEGVRLRAAVKLHHGQKADDRCIEDDDRLYSAAGLEPCDRRVGDKFAMLANCARFIDRRCEGGGWPTYAELEAEVAALKVANLALADRCHGQSEALGQRAEKPA